MKISVIHPTARVSPSEAFPQGWYAAYAQYMATCSCPDDIEYIIVVHESRLEEFWENLVSNGWKIRAGVARAVNNVGRDCVVDQLNAAAKYATGDIIMGTMDDLVAPQGWDRIVLDAFEREGVTPESDALLVMSSGATPQRDLEIMVCGAFTRTRYKRIGYALDPDFESMYADNWFAMQARKDEAAGVTKIITRLDILFEHKHPSLGKGTSDTVYEQQNHADAYAKGLKTLRHKMGDTRQTLALCLPGENFPMEVVANLTNLLFRLSAQFIIQPHFGYSSNVFRCRNYFADVLEANPTTDWVLWIDDDNILTPQSFDMLWIAANAPDAPEVVAAWCWIFDRGKGEFVTSNGVLAATGDGKLITTPSDASKFSGGLEMREYTGFPAVLHRGEIMKRLGKSPFGPDILVDGEDISFCLRCRDVGIRIGVHTGLEIPHLKRINCAPSVVKAEKTVGV